MDLGDTCKAHSGFESRLSRVERDVEDMKKNIAIIAGAKNATLGAALVLALNTIVSWVVLRNLMSLERMIP